MDEERRTLLERKRKQLKAATEARARAALIADVIAELDARGIKYQLEFVDTSWEWVRDHFPVTSWGGIDWTLATRKIQFNWESEEQRPQLLKEIIKIAGLDDEPVVVIWSNADRPAVLMPLADVESVASSLFDQDFDTWIISKTSRWCIESHHNGTFGIVLD
ncbi:CDI toxin immunity protein [Marinobacter zhejiangensis]|uniref:Uncharacterized protein n=1 Tax=Marinobacter zhejiangensis TaxID=488535 RepID=A0A1I4LJD2_9GAMM|nr:hypothetical protein [Marinobacter zhejiangensis]SFL91144.1 hypothetical protein SAMN04487963_0513 [Marinobacter zhejiangensis]